MNTPHETHHSGESLEYCHEQWFMWATRVNTLPETHHFGESLEYIAVKPCFMWVNRVNTPPETHHSGESLEYSAMKQWFMWATRVNIPPETHHTDKSLEYIAMKPWYMWDTEWIYITTIPSHIWFTRIYQHEPNAYVTHSNIIIIIIYPLTMRVVGAPQMISQPVSSIFPCSPLPSWTWQTPGLSIPWCCLPTSSYVSLVFFPLSLCFARWFWPDLMNRRHDHTTAVCVSLQWSGGLCVVQFPTGSWHRLPHC